MIKKMYDAVKNLFIGLKVTGRHLPRKHITLQYPDERWPMPERSRGVVVLLSDKETGELNCTACLLCMRSCPTAAIRIEFEKNEKGKRQLTGFTVDNTICCYCGLCEEACKFDAIKLAPKYEFATFNKEDLIWDTKKLQEVGRDVDYEVTRKKKKPAAKPAAKPEAKKEDKPASAGEAKPEEKKEDDKAEKSAEAKAKPEEKQEDKAASEAPKPEPEEKPKAEAEVKRDDEDKKSEDAEKKAEDDDKKQGGSE